MHSYLTAEYVCDTLNLSKIELREFLQADEKYSLEEAVKSQQLYIHFAIVTILKVKKWAAGIDEAVQWFSSESIPALGGCTVQQAALSGHYAAVDQYIDVIELGGFA